MARSRVVLRDCLSSENDLDVAIDIPSQALLLANESKEGVGNDTTACSLTQSQFILYQTSSLFQDSSIGDNTSIGSLIISAQAGDSPLENLSQPVLMSFNVSKAKAGGEYEYNLTCAFWDFSLGKCSRQSDECGMWQNVYWEWFMLCRVTFCYYAFFSYTGITRIWKLKFNASFSRDHFPLDVVPKFTTNPFDRWNQILFCRQRWYEKMFLQIQRKPWELCFASYVSACTFPADLTWQEVKLGRRKCRSTWKRRV